MTDELNKELTSVDDIDYTIHEVNLYDVIKECKFKDEDDEHICKMIITNLETMAAKELKELKTVSLPAIGQLRINPVNRQLRNNKVKLSTMRKILGKERYQTYVRETVLDLKRKQEEFDRQKLFIKRLRSNNKVKYEKLCRSINRSYAELYLKSIAWLDEIPFDIKWQEQYDRLRGIDRDKLNKPKYADRQVRFNIERRYSFYKQ